MSLDHEFDKFLKKVCPPRELDWRKYRRASRRKVLDRINELGLAGPWDYARFLEHNPCESQNLPNLLRVTVSRFFREKEVWQDLADLVLPALLTRIGCARPLRVLHIGACSGEEPYSLALLWKTRFQPVFAESQVRITGLELDRDCLTRAWSGFYSPKTLRELPKDMLQWFTQEPGGYRLSPDIMSLARLREFDLLKDPLPQNQDLIFCRYLVFTYFRGKRLQQMAKRISGSLSPHGYLVVGQKEHMGAAGRYLAPAFGSPRLYQLPKTNNTG